MIDDAKAMAAECLAYSIKKGFSRTTWDTVPVRLACIYREIEELVEAFELAETPQYASMPEVVDKHVKEELADVAAYALVILSDLGNDDWNLRSSLHVPMPFGRFVAPDVRVKQLRNYTSLAFENWKLGPDRRWDVLNSLQHLVTACSVMGFKLFNCSLDVLVLSNLQAKFDREILHGGKDPRA